MAGGRKGCGTALPRRGHVALLAQRRLEAMARPSDRPVGVPPGTVALDVWLVGVPRAARLTAPLGAQSIRQAWGEARRPVADGLVAEDTPARQEHRRAIPQAQRVAQPSAHDEQHAVGRVLPVVVRCAGPLVAEPPTARTPARALAEDGTPSLRGGRGRGTVGAGHA